MRYVMDLEQMHTEETRALAVVKDIFERNSIEYYLIAGSTLGAVRHRGFIPWDDDIDIGIRYELIRRAEEVLEKELPAPYRLITYRNNARYPLNNPKILYEGYCLIDIYPLVRIPDDDRDAETLWILKKELERRYNRKLGIDDSSGPAEKLRSRAGASLYTREQLISRLESACDKYSGQDTKRFINLFSVYSFVKEQILTEWLDEPETVTFEGLSVPSVGHTDAYLTHLYGDYMKLPPEEERIPKHEDEYYGDILD